VGTSVAVSLLRAVVMENTAGGLAQLRVLDVSNVLAPVVTGTLATGVPFQPTGTHYMGVALNSNATLAAMALGTTGVWLVNVDAPTPAVVGMYNTPGTAFAVALDSSRNLLYVADGASGLEVFDISDPTVPQLAGSVNLGGTTVGVGF